MNLEDVIVDEIRMTELSWLKTE